jgi:hypothetical protein
MFFVVSTGRCGSKSIAGLLNELPKISCVHEQQPALAYEARAYLKGDLSRQELVVILRDTRRPPQPGVRYGESNQKLSYMIDVLHEAFPDASFLWLVRNGLDVVASYYSRGAYRQDEMELFNNPSQWVRHRLRGYEVSAMSQAKWRMLDSFARNCWFWGWTNEKIKNDLNRIGAKWLLVRLEDLETMRKKIASFLGLNQTVSPKVPRLNVSPGGKVSKARFWDRSQRESFTHFCGPLMDELYPGWRESLEATRREVMRNELLSIFSSRHAFGRFTGKILKTFPSRFLDLATKLSHGRRN